MWKFQQSGWLTDYSTLQECNVEKSRHCQVMPTQPLPGHSHPASDRTLSTPPLPGHPTQPLDRSPPPSLCKVIPPSLSQVTPNKRLPDHPQCLISLPQVVWLVYSEYWSVPIYLSDPFFILLNLLAVTLLRLN